MTLPASDTSARLNGKTINCIYLDFPLRVTSQIIFCTVTYICIYSSVIIKKHSTVRLLHSYSFDSKFDPTISVIVVDAKQMRRLFFDWGYALFLFGTLCSSVFVRALTNIVENIFKNTFFDQNSHCFLFFDRYRMKYFILLDFHNLLAYSTNSGYIHNIQCLSCLSCCDYLQL